jgi:hypothetical protein
MDQKEIGPSFSDELAAYGGLIGQHFTWSPDGTIEFFDDTPQSVIDGVNAVYAAHDPTKGSVSQNTATRDGLLASAALSIAPLQDAVDLDEATSAETSLLKQWKQYRVAVNRVDLTQRDPAWPSAPQAL